MEGPYTTKVSRGREGGEWGGRREERRGGREEEVGEGREEGSKRKLLIQEMGIDEHVTK